MEASREKKGRGEQKNDKGSIARERLLDRIEA